MSESELAARLQAEKDDLSQWDEVTAPTRAGKRKLSAMVSVRLSPEELERVQERAEESGQSVSSYLRNLALRDAAKGAFRPTTRSAIVRTSGAPYESSVLSGDAALDSRSYPRAPRRAHSATRITTSAGSSQGWIG